MGKIEPCKSPSHGIERLKKKVAPKKGSDLGLRAGRKKKRSIEDGRVLRNQGQLVRIRKIVFGGGDGGRTGSGGREKRNKDNLESGAGLKPMKEGWHAYFHIPDSHDRKMNHIFRKRGKGREDQRTARGA